MLTSRILMLTGVLVGLTAGTFTSFSQSAHPRLSVEKLHDGDIIFQSSQGRLSEAIKQASHSRYSHCGLLYHQGNQWLVYEAVEPVSSAPLADWIARGEGGHFVVKRLRDAATRLTPADVSKLKAAGEPFRGKSYDGAFNWSDDRIYCSELVWKVYKNALGVELASLQQLRDFDLSAPVVQQQIRKRYGNQVPLNEPIISPEQLFTSKLLITVVSQ